MLHLLLIPILRTFYFLIAYHGQPLVTLQLLQTLATEPLQQAGASTYHSGIDIAAPTGANLIASFSGEITFLGWNRCWSDIL